MKYIFTLAMALAFFYAQAQQDIADARSEAIGSSVTIVGIVTNGPEFGSLRYIQDKTGGIAAYGNDLSGVQRGDSVIITGELSDYYKLLEIQPIQSVRVRTSGNAVPAPKVITIGQLSEEYEGQLVRINNVRLTNPSGSFQKNTNYGFSSNDEQSELRITSSILENSTMPVGAFDLIGICGQHSYSDPNSGYQVIPRDENDLIVKGSVKITAPISVVDFSSSSITLNWETDVEGISGLRYGSLQDEKSLVNIVPGSISAFNEGFLSESVVNGLQPASVIYAQGFTVLDDDTAFTAVKAFATESNSSGDIKVYFNTAVDHSAALSEQAVVLNGAIDDTLIAYIGRAKESIDVCIYNINNAGISNITEALNQAFNSGVEVRLIACGTTAHLGVDNNGSDIPEFPVLIGPDDYERDGIMHNKFLVFDANSSDTNNPLVWTGSTNFTVGQIDNDANNVVIIQDQALAAAYTIEFEEMWGGSERQPNEATAKFGEYKTDNTPHEFRIGGKRVECYFSPSDGTNQEIVNTLATANNEMDIATMLITRSDIAYMIRDRAQAGVSVHVITDSEGSNSTTVNGILGDALGSDYVFDNVASHVLHSKYAIVDEWNAASDPLVLTGSHNWSSSANEINDENTVIIHDQVIANLFWQNFVARFSENNGIISEASLINEKPGFKAFPNPAGTIINIVASDNIEKLEVFEISGVKIFSSQISSSAFRLNTSDFEPGMYILKAWVAGKGASTLKFMKK